MLGSTIRLQIEPTEGDPYAVTISLKTAIAFEREFKTTLAGAFSDNPSIEHICWLGWQSTRDSGRVVKLFDEWVQHDIKDITVLEDDADPLVSNTAPIQSLG
tara:strand:+ start:1613 stop:1918 length:306 start_codon:yes stop_codon:yes gene_type:complete